MSLSKDLREVMDAMTQAAIEEYDEWVPGGNAGTDECVRATLVKALGAADAALEAGPWREIETAPKDGTLLLLLERHGIEPFIGRWGLRGWIASKTHYDTDGNACVIDCIDSDGVAYWMPLPAAPKEQK